LLAFADACRRASADSVTAIVPYFGYARSDKRDRRREPITASLIAALLECAGVRRVMLVDVHAPQIEGFFRGPADQLTAIPELLLDGVCDRMARAGVDRVYVTDSVEAPDRRCGHTTVVTIAPLLAAAIRLQLCDGAEPLATAPRS
jgi:phosphoribosylpyrophosphate synthetase